MHLSLSLAMSSVVWLPSLNLLRISANCLLSLCLMISCNSNMVKSSFQRLGARAPYSESFMSLNTYLSITGSSWNKSPSAITLTPPNASLLPLISFNLLFICTLNMVFPTIDISSRNISLSAWSLHLKVLRLLESSGL